ncbi:MAG: acyltransferase [Lachnospiraceae bacterium]|nr:acyltransferase [Lachnospiraceae bacterium]
MYGKKEARMTKGLAILCMLTLHLFCRKGADVYGTPLIWLNDTTPLVYYFGFFAEICVPLYTLCTGYAQQLLYKAGGQQWKGNLRRIWRLMLNYWVILVLFSMLGLLFPSDGSMPGTLAKFLKSIVLLYSYNGAWWYLDTYIIMMLIPPIVLLLPVRKCSAGIGLICCLIIQFAYYISAKFGFWPEAPFSQAALAFIWNQLDNLVRVLPYFWAGAFLCKGDIIEKAGVLLDRHAPNHKKLTLLSAFAGLFIGICALHQAILMPAVAVMVFLLFNLWKKGVFAEKIFMFLGKHSTNIWLTHMFFYLRLFPGTVQKAKYPLFMLLLLIGMSIGASFCINAVLLFLKACFRNIRLRYYSSDGSLSG